MRQRVYRSDQNIYLPIYFLKVWLVVFKKSVSKNMVFRVDFLSKFVRLFLVLFIQIIFVRSLFSQTDQVAGWSIESYYLLIGVYNIVNYVSWGLFNLNLFRIEEKVIKGEFDFLLLYPTGSIFSASFSEFFIDDFITSLSGFILVGYYFINNFQQITILSFIGFLITVLMGIIIWYSIHLGAASINFITPKNGMMNLLKSMSVSASFPVDVYGRYLRIFLYTIFPIAFIAAVPARVLSGVFSWEFVLASVVVAIVALLIARMIWKYSLRMYSSSGG